MRFARQQYADVVAIDLDALASLVRNRLRLVRSSVQHRSKSKKLAHARLIDQDFLIVFIDRLHPNCARDNDVPAPAFVADLPDPLPSMETFQFNLTRQY